MLYVSFMLLAILYNIKKFHKERAIFISSLLEAKSSADREMILGHNFYIYVFESFLALIVAHLVSENTFNIGILGIGLTYLSLLFVSFYFYQFFIRYLERHTGLELYDSFKGHIVKELRVNFSMIILPILVYAIINWAVFEEAQEDGLWFVGTFLNIILVSVLTIVCSVVIMLRLIPNREVSEDEYLEIINKRLAQMGEPNMRVRWIEADIKNAFVVGLKLLSFSNQTMFIGRSLRNALTMEEFDAVVCHELSHVANRHIHKRVLDHMKTFIGILFGAVLINVVILACGVAYWGETFHIHKSETIIIAVVASISWFLFNYVSLFDGIRSHEYEADAYAVLEMGASFVALKSALEKITSSAEVPLYLKNKTKPRKKSFLGKYFSTHPEVTERISSLENKIFKRLPFNHYVSPTKKIRNFLGHLFSWKVTGVLTATLVLFGFWIKVTLSDGTRTLAYIENATKAELLANKELVDKVNSRPYILGSSYMYYLAQKKDAELLDHFLERGADKGRTLIYLSQIKEIDLFKRYYVLYQNELTDGEFFLILRSSADMNFTEGYRLLVNAKQFENLNLGYKEDIASIHSQKDMKRLPASAGE